MEIWTAMPAMPAILGRASLEGGVLILAVWAFSRLFPRLPAAFRTWLWWLACLRLVISLVGVAPLRLPLLPAAPAPEAPVATVIALGAMPAPVAPLPPSWALGALPPQKSAAPWSLSLATLEALGALWLLAAVVQLVPLRRQFLKLRGIRRRSTVLTEGPLAGLWERLCREQGVSSARLLLSAEVATPQAVGLFRPRVILPRAGLDRLSPGELSMVLCHELAHLRRGDLWLGWVPALASRLFFFHPLATLAVREYALAREAACDAEVLAVLGETPQAYGRLLLRLGITPRAGGLASLSSVMALATAAPSRRHLKRRLEMLAQASRPRHLGWWCLLGLIALFALVPFRIVAAQEASHAVRASDPAPQPPPPPRAPIAPRPPKPHSSHSSDSEEYVLLRPNGSSTMNGSMGDVERARKLLGPGEKEILWFRHGGKEYVVRDSRTLEAAFALFAPQEELGRRQADLGSRQAELGSRQAALGAEQAKLGAKQARLGAEQARVVRDEGRATSEGREINDRLARQQDDLSKQQDDLGRQQDELGKKQDALGKQQDELGAQQDELGAQQDKLAKEADEKFQALLIDAISRSLATEVGR
jgi:beta-lactamase regulating signal transducer with metallopeptidase domain